MRLVPGTHGPQRQQCYEAARLRVDNTARDDTQDYWQAADMLGKLGRRLGAPQEDLGKDPQSCGLHCCGSSLVLIEWDSLRRAEALTRRQALLLHSQFENLGARTRLSQ